MSLESNIVDFAEPRLARDNAGDAASRRIALFRCRLCWKIAFIVTMGIIAIEGAILIPSYVSYERDLLRRLDVAGLAAIRAGFALSETVEEAEEAAKSILAGSELVGIALYSVAGETLYSVGEKPDLTLSKVGDQATDSHRNADGSRYSSIYLRSQSGLPFDVVAKLDASWIAAELVAFVWRIIGLVLMITFFVSSVTLLVVGRWVLRPVLKIRASLANVQRDPSLADSFSLKHPRNDEIGDMAESLNALMKHLSESRNSEILAEERRFEDFADASSDWFWEMDKDLRFSYFSDRFTETTGVPQQALLGKTRNETGVPGIGDRVWQQHLETLAAHRPFRDFEHSRPLSNGETVYLSINGKPVFGTDGAFIGYRGTGSDITGRRNAEIALQRANEELEQRVEARTYELRESDALKSQILDTALDCVVSIDRTGSVVEWNAAAEHTFGYSRETVHGKKLVDLIIPEHLRDAHLAGLERYLKTGEAKMIGRRSETFGMRSNGEEFPLELAITAQVNDSGHIITAYLRDVTEAKKAEQHLQQAQKMEAVGQLTGGVAHDFNNLLAVIQGNTELIADTLGADDSLAQEIMRATERGADLTQRLLAFSRQQPLRSREIDLSQLVEGMSGLLDRTLGETIEVETIVDGDIWPAYADPSQVENALLNLAINARDAMPDGGKLAIKCGTARLDPSFLRDHPEATTGDYVVLSVTDNGRGMSPDVRRRAFEPFFTTKEVGDGSGLGLSMIYGFAKQSDGYVFIESEEDRGTTVKLYLPRTNLPPAESSIVEASRLILGNDELILLVEDDEALRDLVVRMLRGLKYRVVDVADAAAARVALENGQKYDLILTDVVLPGGTSGPEFVIQVRETNPGLNVVYMSGYPADAAKRNGLLSPDQTFLNKPFQRRQLASAIRDALA